MKVLMVNNLESIGGAAIVCRRIFKGLKAIQNINISLLVSKKKSTDRNIIGLSSFSILMKTIFAKLNKFLLSKYPENYLFSPGNYGYLKMSNLNKKSVSLVHLHWINDGLLSFKELSKIDVPVVWTLHDSWAFTGGCHVTYDCEKYVASCGSCPRLNSLDSNDISHKLWNEKNISYSMIKKIVLVAPSLWIQEEAKRSPLTNRFEIVHIPNGIDLNVFYPREKSLMREKFKINTTKKIIGINPCNHDFNKGYDLFLKAIKLLSPEKFLVLIIGSTNKLNIGKFEIINMGHVENELEMAQIYSLLDAFVLPSRSENFSTSLIECSASGVPAVAFNVGGNSEIITNGINGFLVEPQNFLDLSHKIVLACSMENQTQDTRFDINRSVDAYIDLYEGLIS